MEPTNQEIRQVWACPDRISRVTAHLPRSILTILTEPIKACRLFGSPPWEEETRDGQEEAGLGCTRDSRICREHTRSELEMAGTSKICQQ